MSSNKTLLYGALAVGAFLFLRNKGAFGAGGQAVILGMKPAKIGANESVSAKTYRQIAERRSGMEYVQAESGMIGGEISFKAPNGGTFTRNVIEEGGQVWIEIKR